MHQTYIPTYRYLTHQKQPVAEKMATTRCEQQTEIRYSLLSLFISLATTPLCVIDKQPGAVNLQSSPTDAINGNVST